MTDKQQRESSQTRFDRPAESSPSPRDTTKIPENRMSRAPEVTLALDSASGLRGADLLRKYLMEEIRKTGK